jgi:hypothetical protein
MFLLHIGEFASITKTPKMSKETAEFILQMFFSGCVHPAVVRLFLRKDLNPRSMPELHN